MKKFIKENWFRIGTISLLLVVALSVGYYFIFFLPNSHARETIIQNQTACSQMEQKVIDKNYPNFITGMMEISSKNHYNLRLNKCLVEINYSFGTGVLLHTEDSVFDALENKTLFDCVSQHHSDLSVTSGCYDHSSNQSGTEISRETFDSLMSHYMTE